MVEYTIVVTNSWLDTKEAVSSKIAEGWQPLGGVSVAIGQTRQGFDVGEFQVKFAQAMIKHAERDDSSSLLPDK